MVESSTKPLVLVMGTLGVGKSTLLNRISGMVPFEAKDDPKGVT